MTNVKTDFVSAGWSNNSKCCYECLRFWSQTTRHGSSIQENTWCGKTKEHVDAYTKACEHFMLNFSIGSKFSANQIQKGGEMDDNDRA